MRSFIFFNGLFYKVIFYPLLLSVVAKPIINIAIKPLSQKGPFPTGRFDITHFEHRYQGWPDYCDGPFGTISCNVSDLIGNVVAVDNLEKFVFFALVAAVVVPASVSTYGQNPSGLLPKYIGMGLIFAGGISNEGVIGLVLNVPDAGLGSESSLSLVHQILIFQV
jgi:hypothetical protein